MHKVQSQILELSKQMNIASLTLRELGMRVGVGEKPAVVQHHLLQLEKKGFLRVDRKNKRIELLFEKSDPRLVRIPVLGAANCGDALSYPEESAESYITVSRSLIGKLHGKVVAAFQATGDSMNRARVPGLNGQKIGIDEGDFVLVASDTGSDAIGKYVISSIDGMANIKKLEKTDHGVLLRSESTKNFPPIYIDEAESHYFVQGIVVGVIKA